MTLRSCNVAAVRLPPTRLTEAPALWQYDTWQPLDVDAHAIAAVESLPALNNKFIMLLSGLLVISADGNAKFSNAKFANNDGIRDVRYIGIQEAASGGGWIWAINTASGNHLGGTIRRSDGIPALVRAGYEWHAFGDVYAKRIAAGLSDGVAWISGEDGKIYRQVNAGEGWIEKPGCATAIANAGNDNVWVVGCDTPDAAGNRKIYQWDGNTWIPQPGSGVEIAVQADGKPWLLQADGSIWRHH